MPYGIGPGGTPYFQPSPGSGPGPKWAQRPGAFDRIGMGNPFGTNRIYKPKPRSSGSGSGSTKTTTSSGGGRGSYQGVKPIVDETNPIIARSMARLLGKGAAAGRAAGQQYQARTGLGAGTMGGAARAGLYELQGLVEGAEAADEAARDWSSFLTGVEQENARLRFDYDRLSSQENQAALDREQREKDRDAEYGDLDEEYDPLDGPSFNPLMGGGGRWGPGNPGGGYGGLLDGYNRGRGTTMWAR